MFLGNTRGVARLDDAMTTFFTKDEEDFSMLTIGEKHEINKEDGEESNKKRWQTLGICVNYFSLGLAVGCIGPTLHQLESKTNSSPHEMSLVFASRGIPWILGSVAASRLYLKVRGHRLLWISIFSISICMALTPLMTNLWALMTVSALSGIFMSWVEVGVNTMVLWIWKEKVGPYMQLLHFSFGLGLGSSPFLVAAVMLVVSDSESQLLISYFLISILVGVSAFFPLKLESPPIEDEIDHNTQYTNTQIDFRFNHDTQTSKYRNLILIILVTIYLLLYGGAENAFGGWISSYAYDVYGFGEADSAYLNSVFWGSLTLGRLFSIPLATKISAKVLLIVDICGSISCLTILLIYQEAKIKALLWTCTIFFGVFMAPIFASAFSVPQELQVKVTSTTASAFLISSGIGDMIMPIFIGWFINPELIGNSALLVIVLSVFVACLILYVIIFSFGISTMDKRINQVELQGLIQLEKYWE